MHAQEAMRPQTWNDLIGLEYKTNGVDTDKERLIYLAETGFSRGLIFKGPPGTGKTSAARLFAVTYYGIEYSELDEYDLYLEKNASGERGIDVIRGEVQEFASIVSDGKARIIVFDEADGLTYQAQEALKAIIEKWGFNCIFIFCLNKEHRIDEAIYSRCTHFTFNPVSDDLVEGWVGRYCGEYNIDITDNAISQVVKYYKGDMRMIISDFIIPNQGREVIQWIPQPTHAEEIFRAPNPSKKYLEIIKTEYIETDRLLMDLLELNDGQNPESFATAWISLNSGGDPIASALTAIAAIVK